MSSTSLSKTLRVQSLVADSVTDRADAAVSATTTGTASTSPAETSATVDISSLQGSGPRLLVVKAVRVDPLGTLDATSQGLLLVGAKGETTVDVGAPTPVAVPTAGGFTLAADGTLTAAVVELEVGDKVTLTVSRA